MEDLRKELKNLSDHMLDVAAKMDYFGGFNQEMSIRAKNLVNAAHAVGDWVEDFSNSPSEASTSAEETNDQPSEKMLLITGCKDKLMWYSKKVGSTVPFLGYAGNNEYRSREDSGYMNFVRAEDCEVVDTFKEV